jgi:hypothetical protein
MSFALFVALTAGAPQVPPPLPGQALPPTVPNQALPPSAAPVSRLDGRWAIVYAEQAGRRADFGPTLDVRNGAVALTFDGRPQTYRLDLGPGYTAQAMPVAVGSAAPVAPGAAATVVPSPRPPATPPSTVPRGPSERTGISNDGLPLNRGTPGSPPATGIGTSPTPASPTLVSPTLDPGLAGRPAVTPGALQGTFILSNEFLCLSLSPTGEAALGTSPGTVRGNDVGPGAAPGSSTSRYATLPTATPAAIPGVRQDALILILRRLP